MCPHVSGDLYGRDLLVPCLEKPFRFAFLCGVGVSKLAGGRMHSVLVV